MHFLAIFYFNVFNNCVADFCTAWLWQPELFNTITDKLIDNFIENINIENIQISKLDNFDTGCIIICIAVALQIFCPESLGEVQSIKIQQYKYLSMNQVKQGKVLNQNLFSRTLLYRRSF